ncbi:MAG: polysaccharide deacetylase family protein [Methanomassiliicoccaceae archaeon]|jgi:peptidoglycan/xylan/chitin deacetylase (PgdA/CDA1 family)|nr:polysaccharide deacetylase family protein [Methanomassiliicoccaceae archaeon]
MTKKFCFTVDVDRDVNICVPGRTAAVSLYGEARFTSSEAGVNIILDMLDDIGISATFFAEARTLENIGAAFGNNEVAMHGLDHEDMTGHVSGIALTETELNDIMRTSSDIIRDRTGARPKGFRAPYMRTNEMIMDMLPKFGIAYDSSLYSELSGIMRPYDLRGIKEIPVPSVTGADGKKTYAYLWPMHEGSRTPDGYIRMAEKVEDGVFVLATHSWHMVETREGGIMPDAQRERNVADVRDIITKIIDGGFEAVRMIDAIG